MNEDCRAEVRHRRTQAAERTARARTTTRQASRQRMSFCYVYILQSLAGEARFYVGLTDNLKDRLRRHSAAPTRQVRQ